MASELYFEGAFLELRQQLQDYLEGMGKAVAECPGLRALLLAGGYGRGEGGVFLPPDGGPPRLYNDLEFYVISEQPLHEVMQHWQHRGEELFGLEIEWKTLTPHELALARPSMFFYDLLSRHVLVAGDAWWMASLPGQLRSAAAIPPVEASRLLVNRGMSLLRCRRWAAGEIELPPDFCPRILAKLKLALADAVLCLDRRYHWSARERQRLLETAPPSEVPPDWETLQAWHAEGVAFKLRPRFVGSGPAEWQDKVEQMIAVWLRTFLWVESRRLRRPVSSARDYVRARGRLFPGESPAKNLLRQLRDRRQKEHLPWAGFDHPRTFIWRALVSLLAGNDPAEAASLLGLPASTAAAASEERLRIFWKRYP